MKILIEGERYSLDKLKTIISDKFYKIYKNDGIITHVGYFYSFENKEVVYILPKVFIGEDGKVLFNFDKDDLFDKQLNNNDLRYFVILFYRSLIEYRKREKNNIFLNKSESLLLDSNIGENEYSFLDIILNIVNYHRENHRILLFIEKKYKSEHHKKVTWDKTIRKTMPLISNGKPIYLQSYNKKKAVDSEENLLSIFYSVLNNIKKEYKFNINIDNIYTIHVGKNYKQLCKKAPKILKKIKYKYFSDTLKNIYKLMELYFDAGNHAKSKRKSNEFIIVDKYHIIFEDMIDNLFSDNLPKELKKLKVHDDGKEVDHLFEYSGLLNDQESIYYIGDSKYYKTGANIGTNSKYKQFTYAKNIIQFNIDVLNRGEYINDKIRYRDELTEGYNISPNFFIQGIIDDMDYSNPKLDLVNKAPENLKHFDNRLFDRDTLIVHYYRINFLYVLKSYSFLNNIEIEIFKEQSRIKFKDTLTQYLQDKYKFYIMDFETDESIKEFVFSNFKKYNGKMYIVRDNPLKLIFAFLKGTEEILDNAIELRLST